MSMLRIFSRPFIQLILYRHFFNANSAQHHLYRKLRKRKRKTWKLFEFNVEARRARRLLLKNRIYEKIAIIRIMILQCGYQFSSRYQSIAVW